MKFHCLGSAVAYRRHITTVPVQLKYSLLSIFNGNGLPCTKVKPLKSTTWYTIVSLVGLVEVVERFGVVLE